jgi:ubiquinone biosynthesis protein Coq4
MTEREQEIIIQKKIANVSLQYLVLVYLYSPRAVLMLSVVLRRTTMEDNENLDCI